MRRCATFEAMRFIETEPYKGARVRAVSHEELAKSYPVRAALEELAGQFATSRAEPELFIQLDAELQAMRTSARNKDQHGLLVHDARFHELIVEAAGNEVLLDTWGGLRIEAFTLVSVITSHLDLVAIANAHLPILDALRQGDSALTGKVMKEHIMAFGDLLLGDSEVTDTRWCCPSPTSAAATVELAGGKGASLASMTANGLPVPPGFVITSAAFARPSTPTRCSAPAGPGSRRGPCRGRADAAAACRDQGALRPAPGGRRSPSGPRPAPRTAMTPRTPGSRRPTCSWRHSTRSWTRIVECWLSFFSERALFYREHKGRSTTSAWPWSCSGWSTPTRPA